MDCLRRAVLYLFRKTKQTCIQLLVLSIICVVVLTSIMMIHGVREAMLNMSKQLMSSFSVCRDPANAELYDYDRVSQKDSVGFYSGPRLDEDMLNTIIENKNIVDYNWEKENGLGPFSLLEQELVPGKADQWLREGNEQWLKTDLQELRVRPLFDSNNDTSLNRYFKSGQFMLVEGRHITNNDRFAVIVSEDYAKYNQIELEDTISIGITEWDAFKVDFQYYTDNEFSSMRSQIVSGPYDLTVIGIYKIMLPWSGAYEDGLDNEQNMPQNLLFVDRYTGDMMADVRKDLDLNTVFHDEEFQEMDFTVKDPGLLEKTIQELEDRIPEGELLKWETNEGTYTATTAPLVWLSKAILLGLAGIMILIIVILVLMNVFMLRTRMREMAVMMSNGMNKGKIVFQMILEKIILVVLAIALAILPSLFLGKLIVQKAIPVAAEQSGQEELLNDDYNRYEMVDMFEKQRFFTVYRDLSPEIRVVLSGKTIIMTGFLMLLTTVFTVLVSCIPLWRSTPRRLLTLNQ